jgi:gas vesicle protein
MSLKRKFLVGTIVGGAVGSVVGILVAPKSGKQTRSDIAKKGAAIKADVLKRSGTGKKRSLLKGMLRSLIVKKKRRPPQQPPA